jgi:hypothetical protein
VLACAAHEPAPLPAPLSATAAPPPPASAAPEVVASASSAPPIAASAAASAVPEPRRLAGACAEVGLAFDLRLLPVGPRGYPSEGMIDGFVASQASRVAEGAPGEPRPTYVQGPGSGILRVQFEAPTQAAALARCEKAVKAYMPHAPTLPLATQSPSGKWGFEPATSVSRPCARCPART